jgi:crotonobetainyl-CoA:carnitine CoA-transferase CaiB-like acyl-CoA transferase
LEFKAEKDGFLKGIQVLDLANEKASFCSRLLADLGARVIKIEKPGGDPSRKIGPLGRNPLHAERSLSFSYNNMNKMGITLNLEHEEGKGIFFRLLEKTDIIVETFHPGYLKEIGLGYDVLDEKNPKLILCSVTGFGGNGPRSQYKSCDLVASAFGGQMYVSGSPSTPPLKAFGEQSCYTASLFAAIGILLALRKRARSGTGEHIDISLQEAVVSTLDHVMVRYFYDLVIPKRQGSLSWNNSFCIMPCKDGHMLLTLFQQWETLVEWVNSEGMAEDLKDEKYLEEEYRLRHVDHIIEVFKRWTKNHSTHELLELGQLMRFPWAPVNSPNEVVNNPQLKARGFFIEVNHPEIGTSLNYPGAPCRFSSSLLDRWKRAPLIGEDNIQIYQRDLGLSGKELQELSSMGAI